MLGANPGLFDGTAEREIRQAWAETIALYELWGEERFLRSLTLPKDVAEESMQVQERYTEEDQLREMVLSWVSSLPDSVERINVRMAVDKCLEFNSWQAANMPKWMQRAIAGALDDCPGWAKQEGKQRCPGYGISRVWDREALPNK